MCPACGDSHAKVGQFGCPFLNTCQECNRIGIEMNGPELCADCEEESRRAHSRKFREQEYEARGDHMRDAQNGAW